MKPWLATMTLALGLFAEAAGPASGVPPAALAGWQRYVTAVEDRRDREVAADGRFLMMDFTPASAADRKAVLAGRLVIAHLDSPAPGGPPVEIDDGMVHHWRGAVFLPGVTLDALMTRLQSAPPPLSAEVLRASILDRGPSSLRVFLRLQRTKIVTVVYNTEHHVTFARQGRDRASNRSVATRIAEVDDAGTRRERERPAGEDRGFLWRLHAYWRYEAVPGGVIAECESISLSRDVPFGLGAIVGPIIRSTARESMERALEAVREIDGLSSVRQVQPGVLVR